MLLGCSVNAVAAADDSAIRVRWGYSGYLSPSHWGRLSPQFTLCSTGQAQSPINITKKFAKSDSGLSFNYHPAALNIIEDGSADLMIGQQFIVSKERSVQLNFPANEPSQTITFNGQAYKLVDIHFHSPSEHMLAGKAYPLEAHLVHQGENGEILVVSVFFRGGSSNALLDAVLHHLPAKTNMLSTLPHVIINPTNLLPESKSFYSFDGSLTTPPCTEGLHWVVLQTPVEAAPSQMMLLRKAMGGVNARPVQPLMNRLVSNTTESR